jgi:Mg2+/Co2+ transporter CorB
MIWGILIIVGLIGCSAFFAAAETALTAASRPRMHGLENEGNRRAGIVNRLRLHMEQVIGTLLLGNNMVNIMASALATGVLIDLVGPRGVVYATAVMTVLIVVFGEVMPKTYAINNADRLALGVAPAMQALVRLASPVIRVMQILVRAILRLMGARVTADLGAESAEAELRGAIDLHADAAGEEEGSGAMLHSILDLGDVIIGDITVHRSNLSTIDADQSPEKIVEAALASPHTRLPLWRGDPDNIIGVLHAKALLRAVQARGGRLDDIDIVGLALPPWFVPESTSLLAQLRAFRSRREHFALVVDEYGALMGIVTLEDIIEEIVGEIQDEYDQEDAKIVRINNDTILVDAGLNLEDLANYLDIELPEGNYESVAGFITQLTGELPKEQDQIEYKGLRFTIREADERKISQVEITRLGPAETSGDKES